MNRDSTRNAPTDVPFVAVGTGHNSGRKCDAITASGFLCGKPSRSTGPARSYCSACETERALRRARAAV